MDIKVLGPLEAHEGGKSIVPSAAKPRQILAVLALQASQVVTVPTLMEELWGPDLPRSASTTLQTYILQLRRLMTAGLAAAMTRKAKDVLVTRHGGYMLDVSEDEVDVHVYDRLSIAGRRALEAGDYESASRLLGSSLDLWRGQALVDVQVGSRLEIDVIRLEESRLGVLESRIDADLRLGRHHMLLSELAVLTARHPMHESLCAQFMIALYRSGRQWRALDMYQRLRDTLVSELGVEPSARLKHLQGAILNSDALLDQPAHREALAQQQIG
ncbi:AfsR/SARP family transcriptional regulator [Labedaea rhizosphaerae]|uniref:DNA-binding SARP family transcriptional activator n=1 Tax=Labedaea rhizosphaerae TaxID=598644 RepID=A0A4R6SAX0_LABRH|nr:AfsR/SARP family transcriptional regulator [Labedaea rhizosphaerae]TDP96597.1 DNA-binding SARP family transcriptional activator [Labedaea rhizosphaerae]